MKFTPLAEEDLPTGAFELLPPGDHKVLVRNAEDQISKSGNEMIKLSLEGTHQNGNTVLVWDYLLGLESMMFKLRHFCAAAGLMALYDSGTLTAKDCLGQIVTAVIKVQKGSGDYPDRNIVADYRSGEPTDISDDDIPF